MNNKEFDRSVCFQFYESYLEQAELVKDQLGFEACANYFIALVRYGLYQEEPKDPMIKMLISGLKNTIDAGQSKRARGFNGENKEQTEAILKYIQDNPGASQREIAKACDCSIGKVNKVINSNSNNNINNNSNLNSNNNSVNVNVNTDEIQEERDIEDLTEEEAQEIIKKIRKKVPYIEIQKEYHLKYGSITKNFEKQWNKIKEKRFEEQDRYNIPLYERLSKYWNCSADDIKLRFRAPSFLCKYNLKDIVELFENHPEYSWDSWYQQYGDKTTIGEYGYEHILKYPYARFVQDVLERELTES